MAWIEGFFTGVAMIIFIGPVLFTLLQASLSYGFRGGMAVALGIIVSDVLAVVLCLYGAAPLFSAERNQFVLALVGALLLLGMGISYLLKKKSHMQEVALPSHLKSGSLFIKGFLVNFINPFVFLVWIGLIGYAQEKFPNELLPYLGMALFGIFLIDACKAYFAVYLRKWLQEKRLLLLYRLIALILIFFALRLFFFAFFQS